MCQTLLMWLAVAAAALRSLVTGCVGLRRCSLSQRHFRCCCSWPSGAGKVRQAWRLHSVTSMSSQKVSALKPFNPTV